MAHQYYNNTQEVEKSNVYETGELVQYLPNAVVCKTIMKRTTGNITAMAFDAGLGIEESISPFDTFVQVIDGTASVIINQTPHHLPSGNSIVIPANATHYINSREQFKLISTIIKSGYE